TEAGLIRASEHFEIDGAHMLELARRFGLEGIVCKRADAAYRSGRGTDWLKIKCTSRQEFVIAGYEKSERRIIRALLLGAYTDDTLHYVGRVGTGFDARCERDLARRFERLTWPVQPFIRVPQEERGRPIVWLRPALVCETEFLGWSSSRLIRQGSFK